MWYFKNLGLLSILMISKENYSEESFWTSFLLFIIELNQMNVSRNSTPTFELNVFKITFLLSSKLLCCLWKKIFVYVFTLLIKNYVNMKNYLVRNLKRGANWLNMGHQDSIPKIRTVMAKLQQLEFVPACWTFF